MHAQSLTGKVRDGETGLPLNAVQVTNQTNQLITYTSATGDFSINAKQGDKISFVFIGYKTQVKTVPASLGNSEMDIDLFKLSYQLDEFVFRSKYSQYQLDSMERKSTYQRALARQKSGSIMSPVTFLAEKLSHRSKQIFNFQKSFNYWEDQKFIETRYSPELVQQLTKLQGDTLAWFMNANPMPVDYARAASELELKIWIRERYREWIKNPQYYFVNKPDTTATKQ